MDTMKNDKKCKKVASKLGPIFESLKLMVVPYE